MADSSGTESSGPPSRRSSPGVGMAHRLQSFPPATGAPQPRSISTAVEIASSNDTLVSRGGAPVFLNTKSPVNGVRAPRRSQTVTNGFGESLSLPPGVSEAKPGLGRTLSSSGVDHEALKAYRAVRPRKVDVGYSDDVSRARDFSQEGDLDEDEQAQRFYLSGPHASSDSLYEEMQAYETMQRQMGIADDAGSVLESPAVSVTSTPMTSAAGTPMEPLPGQPSKQLHMRPEILDSTPSRPRPRAFTLSHSAFGSFGAFPSTARAGPLPAPTIISRIKLFFLQLTANAASAAFLIFIVIWALTDRFLYGLKLRVLRRVPKRERPEWETDENIAKYKSEKVTKEIRYYARNCGFDVSERVVETKDGYLLKMYRVECLKKKPKIHKDGRGGFPVLIQHGLFQTCGSFITSEERSLAFWLAEHGDYQVYLGNNRGVFDMGHVSIKRSDPRFWDYNIKELALYDIPAMVDHVRKDTGYDQIAFIGHSQGNATMFCSLAQGMVPELGEKISLFVALAPAVYAGPLTSGFPFSAIKSMKWKTWRRWFGVLDFIPIMRISYNYVPSRPFGLLGYQMFAFLFNWTDANWLLRRKAKKFCFMPSPVSSASIFWWTGYNGFSTRGCVLDPNVEKWFDQRFPPLAIHHGGKDYLVLTEPLIDRLREKEHDVKVIRIKKMEEGEHCDFFWHVNAVELCFESILEDIEKTRPRYPEEEDQHELENGHANGNARTTRSKRSKDNSPQ